MSLWLATLAMSGFAAAPVGAAPKFSHSITPTEAPPPHSRSLSFRLVEDRIGDPRPVHHSGMIAHTEVAPNATIGVGLFKISPKRPGTGDWRDGRAPKSRKAAIKFVLGF